MLVPLNENSTMDPAPELWMTEARRQSFKNIFIGEYSELLALSGKIRDVLNYWIKLQIFLEIKDDESIWPKSSQLDQLHSLREAWLQKFSLQGLCLNSHLLDTKVLVTPACKKWASLQWKHKTESLFLENKEVLDQASCRLIRVSDKNIAHELYYRFLAKESSFEQLATEYGEGAERFQGGLIPLQSLSNMPLGLDQLLKELEPEKVMSPCRLGEGFVLVQLLVWKPAVLDDKMIDQLLQLEFTRWLEAVVSHLQKELTPP